MVVGGGGRRRSTLARVAGMLKQLQGPAFARPATKIMSTWYVQCLFGSHTSSLLGDATNVYDPLICQKREIPNTLVREGDFQLLPHFVSVLSNAKMLIPILVIDKRGSYSFQHLFRSSCSSSSSTCCSCSGSAQRWRCQLRCTLPPRLA